MPFTIFEDVFLGPDFPKIFLTVAGDKLDSDCMLSDKTSHHVHVSPLNQNFEDKPLWIILFIFDHGKSWKFKKVSCGCLYTVWDCFPSDFDIPMETLLEN